MLDRANYPVRYTLARIVPGEPNTLHWLCPNVAPRLCRHEQRRHQLVRALVSDGSRPLEVADRVRPSASSGRSTRRWWPALVLGLGLVSIAWLVWLDQIHQRQRTRVAVAAAQANAADLQSLVETESGSHRRARQLFHGIVLAWTTVMVVAAGEVWHEERERRQLGFEGADAEESEGHLHQLSVQLLAAGEAERRRI